MSERLVPLNATDLEVALDETLGLRIDVQETPIAKATRPMDAPAAFLPFLASGRGVDVWKPDWPLSRQRDRTGRSIEIDRLHGTLAGIKAELAFADAEVLRAVTPPAEFFLSGSFEDDEVGYRKWLRSLPEIRVYTERLRLPGASRLSDTFDDGDRSSPSAFLDGEDGTSTFFLDDEPPATERATIVRDGVEEEISVLRRPDPRYGRRGEIWMFAWKAEAGAGFFLDRGALDAEAFLGGERGGQAFVEVAFNEADPGEEAWNLVAPVNWIQDVTPEIGFVAGFERVGFYFDDATLDGDCFLDALDPDPPIYRSMRLTDGRTDLRAPGSFLDADRFGIPAFTAELTIDNSRIALRRLLFADAGCLDADAADGPVDPAPIEDARQAVVAGMAVRDTVLLEFDAPSRRSLKRTRRLSDLSLR